MTASQADAHSAVHSELNRGLSRIRGCLRLISPVCLLCWQFCIRRANTVGLLALSYGLLTCLPVAVIGEEPPRELIANSCYLRTYEAADLPALERGVIHQLNFEEGAVVESGSLLATLDDAEARLNVALARVQVQLAQRRIEDSSLLEIADAKLKEARQLVEKARTEQEIARLTATSSIAVQQAKKSLDTSQADLDRAIAARNQFRGSVSDTELNRLTYIRDRSQLDIEAAEEERVIAALESRIGSNTVATAEAVLERLQFELSQAKTDLVLERIDLERLLLQLELAETQLKRRTITAPFTGMIVERYHHQGEWLDPGTPLCRIVRLDKLLVEGYADARLIHHTNRGAVVTVRRPDAESSETVQGTLSFISPEVDPVNQQVQIRAIIENSAGKLRAGEAVSMTIRLQ